MSATLQPAVVAGTVNVQGLAEEDFESIVLTHQQRIYRLLLTLLRDPDAAATLTQDCFLRAYEKRHTFRGEASVGTWLTHIAVNLVRDHVRNRRQGFWKKIFQSGSSNDEASELAVSETVVDAHATPEQQVLAREQAETVWRAVSRLSGQQREVFVLRFSEEMPLEEIAVALDVSVGTVKSHLSRAVAAVRKQLKETYGEIALQRR